MGAAAAGETGGLAGGLSKATPFIGMGLSAVNMLSDLSQAGKQADMAEASRRAAEDASKKQEQLASQNFFNALQVPMGAYDRAAKETTAQVGQMTQALQEGDSRNLAGGVGKLAAAGIQGEAETRDAAAQDLYKLGIAQAQGSTNVNQNLAELEQQRLAGAQQAAAQHSAANLGLLTGAAQAGAGLINQGLGMVKSFGMDEPGVNVSTGPNPNFQSPASQRYGNYYEQNNPLMTTAAASPFGPLPAPNMDWLSSFNMSGVR